MWYVIIGIIFASVAARFYIRHEKIELPDQSDGSEKWVPLIATFIVTAALWPLILFYVVMVYFFKYVLIPKDLRK